MGAVEIARGTATFARGPTPAPGGQGPPVRGAARACASIARSSFSAPARHRSRHGGRPPTPDEKQIDRLELRGNRAIAIDKCGGGRPSDAEQAAIWTSKYGADGQALEQAVISGDGVIELAGEPRTQGVGSARTASTSRLAPDGSTPIALIAREKVSLTLPAERHCPGPDHRCRRP